MPATPPMCNICGVRPAGSEEHLPPQGAGNDTPVRVYYMRSNGTGGTDGASRVARRGFVVRTICSHCNRQTGGSFGAAYIEFARQFSVSGLFETSDARAWIGLKNIQPRRVIQQMAVMFLAAQPQLNLEHWERLRWFVRRRDAPFPSEMLRCYLYRNTSGNGRVAPMAGLGFLFGTLAHQHVVLSEVAWRSVGIVFCAGTHPLLARLRDITGWAERGFRERISDSFSVPQLRVESHWPLGYGTPRQVERWVNTNGAVWLGNGVGDEDIGMSVLTRHER